VVIALSHVSNGGHGRRDPGQESLAIVFELPLTRLGSRGGARGSADPARTR